jgi:hypothetical protein
MDETFLKVEEEEYCAAYKLKELKDRKFYYEGASVLIVLQILVNIAIF